MVAVDLGLKGKVILVTGGGAGIGAAITRACLAEGTRVAVVGRRSQNVEEFLAEMAESGADCTFFEAHLEDAVRCREIVAEVEQQLGGIFGLVNNAGVNDRIGLEAGSVEEFVVSLHRNLVHYYALAHYALPALKRAGGTIVNVSSKVAFTGQGGTSAYAASKGAQLALTREWAAELAPAGIRVNAVVPAEVMTPLYRRLLDATSDPEGNLRQITARIPLGHRMTLDSEIAAAVVFLLSPTQSGHTTGQHLVVDGGYVHLDRALS